jgi:hypothetical protein
MLLEETPLFLLSRAFHWDVLFFGSFFPSSIMRVHFTAMVVVLLLPVLSLLVEAGGKGKPGTDCVPIGSTPAPTKGKGGKGSSSSSAPSPLCPFPLPCLAHEYDSPPCHSHTASSCGVQPD